MQAVLIFAFSFGYSDDWGGNMAPFLAASVLLLVPGWQRWAAYAAVVVSNAVLYAALPLSELGPPFAPRPLFALLDGVVVAEVGLMVYGLSRLAWRARELEGLRDHLARMAAVRERLRVARDVHDLLGLGLSAVALKADLIGALLGRDDTRAAAELEEMSRICAAAHADIRRVTGQSAPLSLARELDDAREILASAGVEVRAGPPGGPLPAAADEVLGPVLREAVTNILRHSTARTCGIEVTISAAAVRLAVSNDGVPGEPSAGQPAGDGTGLANMRVRVEAAAGQLTFCRADRWFTLTAEIPLADAGLALAVPGATVAARPDPVSGSPARLPMTRSPQTIGRSARPGADRSTLGELCGFAYASARQVCSRVCAAMVAAVRVRRPQKVCAPWRASSIRSVISLKVVLIRLRHSAMAFSRLDGIAACCFLPGGTRTAVPRAACAAANALPLKPLSASRSRGAGPSYRWYRERDFAAVAGNRRP